jgi:hypothetical protein
MYYTSEYAKWEKEQRKLERRAKYVLWALIGVVVGSTAYVGLELLPIVMR